MSKFIHRRSELRLSTLLCSSITVLLTACGGGDSAEAPQALQSRTAAVIVSHADASVPAGGAPSADMNVGSAAPAQAASSGSAAPAADFGVSGYGQGPAIEANPSTPPGALGETGIAPALALPATTYKLYVSPSGSDSNAGTASAPFRTLSRAASAARASTTVYVAPGTYNGGFKTSASGTASARIYYVSTTKWGARIVPSGSANFAWDNRGNYVDIIGFQVDGTGGPWKNGIYNGGSYDVIRGNWVHHIAKNVACNGSGGSAINLDHYYYGVQSDAIGNLVHDIGPAGCSFIQGIYMSTSGSIKNNVVYRVAEAAIHLWHDATNVIITNNTVTASHTGIIVGGGDFYHVSGPSDYNRVNNNIVYDNAMGISEQGRTGPHNTYRNNLVYQNASYNWRLANGLTHTATVTSAPYFVAYTRTGTPDLRLTSSSPAIGRGTATDALAYDYLERARTSSTGYDIGAYQH
jgi:hypothetical protein